MEAIKENILPEPLVASASTPFQKYLVPFSPTRGNCLQFEEEKEMEIMNVEPLIVYNESEIYLEPFSPIRGKFLRYEEESDLEVISEEKREIEMMNTEPLIVSNQSEKYLESFAAIPGEVLPYEEESDSGSEIVTEEKSVHRIDIRNLPKLRISLERIVFPIKTIHKTLEYNSAQNFSFDRKSQNGSDSESDDSLETVIVNQDINDEILAVNEDMERMEVESDADSQVDLIIRDDSLNAIGMEAESEVDSQDDLILRGDNDNVNVVNLESKNSDYLIHDASEIFVRLEKITLPKKYQYDEHQETDEDENKLGEDQSMSSLLPTCFVALERIDVQTVMPRSVDQETSPAPKGASTRLYGYHLPKAIVRLKRIPVSVCKKYGISIPEHNTLGRVQSKRSYSPNEDNKLYCVLGIKLFLQKRNQESLFEQRVSELRDTIIPMRNSIKMQESIRRRLQRQRRLLKNSLTRKRLIYTNDGNQITKNNTNTP